MIHVQNFHKAYDQTVAVKGISFEVKAGQILGLIGPNGAGKTTTLRSLCGIIPISQGRMTISGFDIDQDPLQAKQHLAYIPDDPQLFHDLTVYQHLQFVASSYRIQHAGPRIEQLLDNFELQAKKHNPVSDLSRGMKQKLAVCCGYLHEPSVILFDEPLTGLDPRGIRSLKDSIVERSLAGKAIIISSHLLAMVEDICTHVLILNEGQQRFCGRISDLRSAFGEELGDASLEEIFFHATTTAHNDESITEFQPVESSP